MLSTFTVSAILSIALPSQPITYPKTDHLRGSDGMILRLLLISGYVRIITMIVQVIIIATFKYKTLQLAALLISVNGLCGAVTSRGRNMSSLLEAKICSA